VIRRRVLQGNITNGRPFGSPFFQSGSKSALCSISSAPTCENRIDSYYPDEGPLRRELYPKHLEFFRAGVEHRERCFLAANRVGKTEGVGGYELTCHLTGNRHIAASDLANR
jgi:hypothetical protein